MSTRTHLLIACSAFGGAGWLLGPLGRLAVSGLIVLFVPGYLLWTITRTALHLPRLVAPTIWLGASLSLIPLMFMWSSALGLRLFPLVLQLQALGMTLLAVWHWLRTKSMPRAPLWLPVSLGGILALTGLTRILEIRGVALPLWVDSVHHTLLIRVIGETGRIPTSLEPYLPVDQLIYHWGYHTVIAAWRGVGDLPLAQGVLWTGQILNALIALVMYGLGAVVLRSPRSGLIAAGVAGLLSLMPAYYVTWGRYTQLTGLLLLPGLLIASLALAEHTTFSWRLVGLTAVLLAGLMLVHYRVLVFYAAFMLPYSIALLLRQRRRAGQLVLRFGAASIGAALLAGPWVLVMLRRVLIPFAGAPAALAGSESYNSLDWALLMAGNAKWLYAVAGASLVLALMPRHRLRHRWQVAAVAVWIVALYLVVRPDLLRLPAVEIGTNQAGVMLGNTFSLPNVRVDQLVIVSLYIAAVLLVAWLPSRLPRWRVLAVGGWIGTMLLLANPNVFGLPPSWFINNHSVAITLFMPVALLVAAWINHIITSVTRYGSAALVQVKWAAVIAICTSLALYGTWQLRSVINPTTVLAQPEDVRAIEWAAENTPPDARFLVNTTAWLNGAYRGTDGGWWLLPLTGRWVSTPPALYIYGSAAYKQAVEALNQRVSALKPEQTAELHQLIRDQRITHIFVGKQPGAPFKADILFSDPLLTPIYDADGVTIFAVRPIP